MANYAIDPAILRPYLPYKTELDTFNGVHMVSLVGFLFKNTRVLGIPVPFHTDFEEFNLRFYVRYKDGNEWKRGVVFVSELVPKTMITFVANTLYGEHYNTVPMRHTWDNTTEGHLRVEYGFKVQGEWNHIKVTADGKPVDIPVGSEEEFITEHYWGYTKLSETLTSAYEVSHPRWQVYPLVDYSIHCNTEALYGREFVGTLAQKPHSVFVAAGSEIKVMQGNKIKG